MQMFAGRFFTFFSFFAKKIPPRRRKKTGGSDRFSAQKQMRWGRGFAGGAAAFAAFAKKAKAFGTCGRMHRGGWKMCAFSAFVRRAAGSQMRRIQFMSRARAYKAVQNRGREVVRRRPVPDGRALRGTACGGRGLRRNRQASRFGVRAKAKQTPARKARGQRGVLAVCGRK